MPFRRLAPLFAVALLLGASAPAVAQEQNPLYTLESPNPQVEGFFGQTVAGVLDTDGDGLGDLLVGGSLEDRGAEDAGRAYLYSGQTGTLLHKLVSPSPEFEGYFGDGVAGIRDADGDGRGDLFIGAPGEDAGAEYAGRAYLFSGATGALLHTLVSPNPERLGYFGTGIDGVRDANGDGRGDLLVGAGRETGGASHSGRAYLFSGATGALLHALVSPNPRLDGVFGISVAGVRDAECDGCGDLLVGAAQEDGGAPASGRAYLFSGGAGTLLRTLTSPNPETNGLFGISVAGVRDADGDGRGDLLVGASSEDGGATNAGRAYLFSGAKGTLLHTLVSPNPQDFGRFGVSVADMPDVDGDGRGDLLIGAEGEDGGAEQAGRAYLFSGATGALLTTFVSPNPEFQGEFSYSVAGVSNADGGGRGDVLIGTPREGFGRVYLYDGATGTPAEPGPAPPASLALAVAPTPARGAATLRLSLDRPQAVTVAVFDGLGRRVAVPHAGWLGAGAHVVRVDVSALPAGVYVVRATGAAGHAAARLTVVQ